jgi:hypothetical protein
MTRFVARNDVVRVVVVVVVAKRPNRAAAVSIITRVFEWMDVTRVFTGRRASRGKVKCKV